MNDCPEDEERIKASRFAIILMIIFSIALFFLIINRIV